MGDKKNIVDSFFIWNHRRRQERQRNGRLQNKSATSKGIISSDIQQRQHCQQEHAHSLSCTTTNRSPTDDTKMSSITGDDTLHDDRSTINTELDAQLSPVLQPITTIPHETLLQQDEKFVHRPTQCSNNQNKSIWSID